MPSEGPSHLPTASSEPTSQATAAAAWHGQREISPHYWEITDRGANFSFLAPERRAQLDAFYALLRAKP